MSKFREDQTHYQHRRPNPHKPAVSTDGYVWWARVIDLDDQYICRIANTQPDALEKAYELAAVVAKQRQQRINASIANIRAVSESQYAREAPNA